MAENKFTDFRQMLREFLSKAELMAGIEPWRDPRYRQVVQGSYADGDETKYLLVPAPIWQEFCDDIFQLLEGRIRQKWLGLWIGFEIAEVKEYPFPDHIREQLLDRITERTKAEYETVMEAVVPISNISMTVDEEIQLGPAYLCPGGPNSALYRQAQRPDARNDLQELAENCFLRITTYGDSDNRIEQVEQKTFDALAVLRFVVPWHSLPEDKISNDASMVDVWGQNKRSVFYFADSTGKYVGFNIGIGNHCSIWDEKLQYMQKVCGLDDVNFHFNRLQSPISRRVIQAIQIYDNALRSDQDWLAFYQYVISIECAIPANAQNKGKFAQCIQQTIYYGGHFRGGDNIPRIEGESNTEYWNRFVSHILQGIGKFYIDRNTIVHGSMLDNGSFQMTLEKLRRIRVIAYNVIRSVARLAIEFKWYSPQDSKKWYKKPIPSPKYFGDAE